MMLKRNSDSGIGMVDGETYRFWVDFDQHALNGRSAARTYFTAESL